MPTSTDTAAPSAALAILEPADPEAHMLATLAPELASAKGYAAASRAANTRRAYSADFNAFRAWAVDHGLSALPAEPRDVALYLASMADGGRTVATIGRALVAISQAHKLAGYDSPRGDRAVQETFKGIRRTLGTAAKSKAPLMVDALRAAVEVLPAGLLGQRDRALLVLGFAGGFRRGELVGLDVADLDFSTEGLTVTLRRSKTDQEGAGRKVGIPYGGNPTTCPVRAVRAWLRDGGITAGPVFRAVNRHGGVGAERLSDRSVANIVKGAAVRAGLDPARFAGHSLRAGLATAAARAGKSERSIMATTGHRSVMMVRRYIRAAELFIENAASGIGL